MTGYIKLYRSLLDNKIWKETPYTRGQAWVDMMMRCNHICVQMGPQYQNVWVLRGQFLLSNIKLGEAWGWNEKTVRRFMDYLVKERMILYFSHSKFCVYEIVKYAEMQALDTELIQAFRAEQKPSRSRAKAEQKPTNNNDNNIKNDKKIYKEYVWLSDNEYQKLILEMTKPVVEDLIDQLDTYILKIGVQAADKKYKSHYAVIRSWYKKRKEDKTQQIKTSIPQNSNYKQREYTPEQFANVYDNKRKRKVPNEQN